MAAAAQDPKSRSAASSAAGGETSRLTRQLIESVRRPWARVEHQSSLVAAVVSPEPAVSTLDLSSEEPAVAVESPASSSSSSQQSIPPAPARDAREGFRDPGRESREAAREASPTLTLFQRAHSRMTTLQRVDEQLAALLEQRRRLQEELRGVQAQINDEFERVMRQPEPTVKAAGAPHDSHHSHPVIPKVEGE